MKVPGSWASYSYERFFESGGHGGKAYDLEKVARAGLEALRDPGEQAHMAGLKMRNDFGSVCNTWEAMIDAILKETP
jgi:hypothetical protein